MIEKKSVLGKTPILDAMRILNSQPHGEQFLIVIDNKGALLGTLTDGDIRRALLGGQQLDGPVTNFMQKKPLYATLIDTEDDVKSILNNVSSANPFLPVLDENKIVKDIKFKENFQIRELNAIIMAGGFGKRLGNKTRNRPKPLIEVQGKPLLEHVLSRLEKNNVSKIFISVHYLSKQIEEFLFKTKRENKVQLIYENEPLGTAGSLGLLPDCPGSDLIVSNADIMTNLDYRVLADHHREKGYDATIAAAEYQVEVPFGVLRHDIDGKFNFIDEKPTLSFFVAAGVYCIKSSLLDLVNKNTALDMPELLDRGKKQNLNIGVFPIHEKWKDVGRPEDLVFMETNY